jgi:hypothetical protein
MAEPQPTTTESIEKENTPDNYAEQIEKLRASRMAEFSDKLALLEQKYGCQVSARLIIYPGNPPMIERVILTTN